MSDIHVEVKGKHAGKGTIYHCIYGYYFLGLKTSKLATIYGKSQRTIVRWVGNYEKNGCVTRKQREIVYKKFSLEKREWIVNLFVENPVLYLNEARSLFVKEFEMNISVGSISNVLHEAGMTWKALERRAIQVREGDICEFYKEIVSMKWDVFNLVFLDEVSFDSRGMLRNRGYGQVGKKLIYRGEFKRRARISSLCFLNQRGIVENFQIDGTFTRKVFFDCCRRFALSGKVKMYPGINSIWILDGARIHCDKNIVTYLSSLGIQVIFLPAYCPYFMPIEVIFGLVKRHLRRVYCENSSKPLEIVVAEAIDHFRSFNATNIFRKCGYLEGGQFDPSIGLAQEPYKLGFAVENQ